jgi:hypothetical protein
VEAVGEQPPAVEDRLDSDDAFHDHFDGCAWNISADADSYFNDCDFEDRSILLESPRLNEFDTNA